MTLNDQALIYVITNCAVMTVGLLPVSDTVKAISFFIFAFVPAWFAWATGMWPFYIMTAMLLTFFVIVVSYNMGKALNDAKN